MIVESYISNDIIPLKIEDSFKLSAHLMDDEKFSYFPVVKDNNLYITEQGNNTVIKYTLY